MKQPIFTGAAVAIVTPFRADGSINFEKLEELIEFQIANDTDAIVICGTTGENATLADAEHLEAIRVTIDCVGGRIPVIAGTGSNDTAHAVMMSNEAEKLGADAVLTVTPYYNKTSQEGLIRHFTFINDRIGLPMLLYNVPSRTGVNILPETYRELAKLKHVAGTKEANGSISAILKTMSLCGEDFYIYSGNDDQAAPITLLGGKGVISVLSNVMPKQTHEMAMHGVNGNIRECVEMQKKYLALCDALFSDVNPIPVKEALNMMHMEVGECRLPLCGMSPAKKEALRQTLRTYALID